MSKRMSFIVVLVAALLAGSFNTVSVAAPAISDAESKSAFVIIGRSEGAYAMFQGVAKDTTAAELDRIRAEVAKQPGYSLVTWQEFGSAINAIAKTLVLRNDYPQYRVIDGLTCLVGRGPSWPWALTWNGGIALTANDYRHAESMYRIYKQNPARYRPVGDPRADPVNPGGFLPVLGCAS